MLINKYLLSNVFRSPDDPAAAPAAGDPPAPPAAVVADPPVAVDPPAAPEPAPQPVARTVPLDALLRERRKGEEKATAAEARAAAAERRAQEAEALAARLQSGQGGDPPARPAAPAPAAPAAQPDFQTAVQQEAARQRLHDDSVLVRNAGLQKFGNEFNQTLNTLTAMGVTTDAVVSDLIAVDKAGAHEILHSLSKDPERAIALAEMDQRSRVAELTRMTMASKTAAAPQPAADPQPAPGAPAKPAAAAPAAPAAPAAKISQAPRPAPALEPSASNVIDWRDDKASDADFSKGFDETFAKRRVMR